MAKLLSVIGAFFLAIVLAVCGTAQAQDYPNKTVRIVVPFRAGGLADLVARIAAQQLQAEFNQPFVVLNVPGANGIQGMTTVLQAPPDGYTLLSASASQWAIPGALTPELVPFDTEKDFQAIGLYTQTSGVFIAVTEKLNVKNIQELVALAKAKPGALNYGSPGIGSIHHLLMEAFNTSLGLDIVHIPYTSSYTPDLLSGQISMAVTALPNVQSHLESGQIRLLAVGNKQRSQLKPDVPTIAESVIPGFDHSGVIGLLARSGTPPAIVEKLSAAIAKFVQLPEVRDRYYAIGAEPVPDVTPANLTRIVKEDRQKYAEIVKELKAKGGISATQ